MKKSGAFPASSLARLPVAGLENEAEQPRGGSFTGEERSHTHSTWSFPRRRVLRVLQPNPPR